MCSKESCLPVAVSVLFARLGLIKHFIKIIKTSMMKNVSNIILVCLLDSDWLRVVDIN